MSATMPNYNEMRRELARRQGARERALTALQAAGADGILNTDLMAIAGSRAGGRVQELRDLGHDITCVPVDRERGLYRYTLRPPTPARLADLPVVAYLTRDGRVQEVAPSTPTRPVPDGLLFDL